MPLLKHHTPQTAVFIGGAAIWAIFGWVIYEVLLLVGMK